MKTSTEKSGNSSKRSGTKEIFCLLIVTLKQLLAVMDVCCFYCFISCCICPSESSNANEPEHSRPVEANHSTAAAATLAFAFWPIFLDLLEMNHCTIWGVSAGHRCRCRRGSHANFTGMREARHSEEGAEGLRSPANRYLEPSCEALRRWRSISLPKQTLSPGNSEGENL